jgi:hypothetical protein
MVYGPRFFLHVGQIVHANGSSSDLEDYALQLSLTGGWRGLAVRRRHGKDGHHTDPHALGTRGGYQYPFWDDQGRVWTT